MNNLTLEQISEAQGAQIPIVSNSRFGSASNRGTEKSDSLVQLFVCFSSFAFCAPALPDSLFYVKQNHKNKRRPL